MCENNYIWLDGDFIIKDASKICHLTHALHYGAGAFECIGVLNGKIFKLREHIERLFHSADILLMDVPFFSGHLISACQELIKLNKIKDGYIKPLIFLESGGIAVVAGGKAHIMMVCLDSPSPFFATLCEKKSLRLKVSSLAKPVPTLFPYSVKTSGLHILNHVVKKRAINKGYDDALLLDYRGCIAEATTSNFFMVKNDIIYTPTTECCLDGITRQTVIEIAKKIGLDVIERHIFKKDLSVADEVFLTGTTSGICAVEAIEDYQYKNNPVSQLLYSKFYELMQK